MSTAIVKIYTPEGFVVAADGFNGAGNDAQKVFRISDGLAFAISGWASLSDEETGLHLLFSNECEAVGVSVDKAKFASLHLYGEHFSQSVGNQIKAKIDNSRARRLISEQDWGSVRNKE